MKPQAPHDVPGSGAPGLVVRDLEVGAGDRSLLRGVAFGLGPGERLGLRGPSGLGKTTLLRALAGLIDPLQGEVRLHGRAPVEWGWPQWRRRVVLLQQRPVMIPGTVRDNLLLPFSLGICDRPWSESEAESSLAAVGLELGQIADQLARDLSVGEQQRVALIRALSVAPDVILLDEPSSALDGEAANTVRDLLHQRCTGQGLACLVVAHDPVWLDGLCQRVLTLGPASGGQGGAR